MIYFGIIFFGIFRYILNALFLGFIQEKFHDITSCHKSILLFQNKRITKLRVILQIFEIDTNSIFDKLEQFLTNINTFSRNFTFFILFFKWYTLNTKYLFIYLIQRITNSFWGLTAYFYLTTQAWFTKIIYDLFIYVTKTDQFWENHGL